MRKEYSEKKGKEIKATTPFKVMVIREFSFTINIFDYAHTRAAYLTLTNLACGVAQKSRCGLFGLNKIGRVDKESITTTATWIPLICNTVYSPV